MAHDISDPSTSLLEPEWGDKMIGLIQLHRYVTTYTSYKVTLDNGIFRVCKAICEREIKDVISKGISDNARSVLNWLICWLT